MDNIEQLKQHLISRLLTLMPDDGVFPTIMPNIVLFKHSAPQSKTMDLYQTGAGILLQGKKNIILEGKVYEQNPHQYQCLLAPMPVEFKTVEASIETPLLGIGIYFDRLKLSKLMLKIENSQLAHRPKIIEPDSVIITAKLNLRLLQSLSRFIDMLSDPLQSEVLADSVEEEIYYQLISQPTIQPKQQITGPSNDDQLINLLANKGRINQIAKAVEYINQHIDQNCTIDELSATVNMSPSGFQKRFKEVMLISPIQYAKQVKLNTAKGLILEGHPVSQALLQVGYNNAGQFSREYKRHFGIPPSEDLKSA